MILKQCRLVLVLYTRTHPIATGMARFPVLLPRRVGCRSEEGKENKVDTSNEPHQSGGKRTREDLREDEENQECGIDESDLDALPRHEIRFNAAK